MDPLLLTVIIVLAVGLFVVTAYMEWIGLINIFTPRAGTQYEGCHHYRADPVDQHDECWRCRHATLAHPSRIIHH